MKHTCCSISDDSLEDDMEVFIGATNAFESVRETYQSQLRNASSLTLPIKAEFPSSNCQRNTSVPCDLSRLSTSSDDCRAVLGKSLSLLCTCKSPAAMCGCQQTPAPTKLSLHCATTSPVPPPGFESPSLKFSPSMTSTLSSAILTQVLPLPSTLSAAAPEFRPRSCSPTEAISFNKPEDNIQASFFPRPAFSFPGSGLSNGLPVTIPFSVGTSSLTTTCTEDSFVTMKELLQVISCIS